MIFINQFLMISDPMLTIHTKTEGVNEYTTLFIFQNCNQWICIEQISKGVKLYVKKYLLQMMKRVITNLFKICKRYY